MLAHLRANEPGGMATWDQIVTAPLDISRHLCVV